MFYLIKRLREKSVLKWGKLKNLPVTDGKKMPIKMVNVVVMSTVTWLYVFSSICSMSWGFFPYDMYCPNSRNESAKLSKNTPLANPCKNMCVINIVIYFDKYFIDNILPWCLVQWIYCESWSKNRMFCSGKIGYTMILQLVWYNFQWGYLSEAAYRVRTYWKTKSKLKFQESRHRIKRIIKI